MFAQHVVEGRFFVGAFFAFANNERARHLVLASREFFGITARYHYAACRYATDILDGRLCRRGSRAWRECRPHGQHQNHRRKWRNARRVYRSRACAERSDTWQLCQKIPCGRVSSAVRAHYWQTQRKHRQKNVPQRRVARTQYCCINSD